MRPGSGTGDPSSAAGSKALDADRSVRFRGLRDGRPASLPGTGCMEACMPLRRNPPRVLSSDERRKRPILGKHPRLAPSVRRLRNIQDAEAAEEITEKGNSKPLGFPA